MVKIGPSAYDETGPLLVECKFTVETREGLGGDFERNTGGSTKEKKITFDGYASFELYLTLMDAVKRTLDG